MFKTTFALLAATAACAVPLSPGKYDTLAALQKRLVINPEITSPQKDTVWTVGSECTVKWSTDLLQEYPETQNYTGTILLGMALFASAFLSFIDRVLFWVGYTEDGDESEHLGRHDLLLWRTSFIILLLIFFISWIRSRCSPSRRLPFKRGSS